eukprot:gb/GECG01001945.1/.p1 GENE.gb/GECG01001945.1/~~gb/GECG01001945.1/.p1  ORF type:complete len:112 (+),score=5.84 gb/GECG01001945.1/:1-336(+)
MTFPVTEQEVTDAYTLSHLTHWTWEYFMRLGTRGPKIDAYVKFRFCETVVEGFLRRKNRQEHAGSPAGMFRTHITREDRPTREQQNDINSQIAKIRTERRRENEVLPAVVA